MNRKTSGLEKSARPRDPAAPAFLILETHSSDLVGRQFPGSCFPQCSPADGALERPTSHRSAYDAASPGSLDGSPSHRSFDRPASYRSLDAPPSRRSLDRPSSHLSLKRSASHRSLGRRPPNASVIGHQYPPAECVQASLLLSWTHRVRFLPRFSAHTAFFGSTRAHDPPGSQCEFLDGGLRFGVRLRATLERPL
jgi:hypothetical protein